jgi:hypothetical protein
LGILLKGFERAATPSPKIHFIDRWLDLDGQAEGFGYGFCRLSGASPAAGLKPVGGRSRQAVREMPGLRPAPCAEPDIECAANQDPIDQVMNRMPYEKNGRGQSARSLPQLSPVMKASVRLRASASVNCCGGDFMK